MTTNHFISLRFGSFNSCTLTFLLDYFHLKLMDFYHVPLWIWWSRYSLPMSNFFRSARPLKFQISHHFLSAMDDCDPLWPSGLWEFVIVRTRNPLKWLFLKSQICQNVPPCNLWPGSTSTISLSPCPKNLWSAFTPDLWILHHLSL